MVFAPDRRQVLLAWGSLVLPQCVRASDPEPLRTTDLKFSAAMLEKLPKGVLCFTYTSNGEKQVVTLQVDPKSKIPASPKVIARGEAPSFSPDGQKVVYAASGSGHPQLYVFDLTSSKSEQLITTKSHDFNPRFSPDGKRIVFARRRSDNSGGSILVTSVDGTPDLQVVLDKFKYDTPAWSPDGKQVAFCRHRGGKANWQVCIATLDPLEISEMTAEADSCVRPAWSPDGKQLVVCSGTDRKINLRLFDLATRESKSITEYDGVDMDPVWIGPNHILFSREMNASKGDFQLHMVELKEGKVVRACESLGSVRGVRLAPSK